MRTGRIMPCEKCHAEVSNDHETCPHCGGVVPEDLGTSKVETDNEQVKILTNQVVTFERENTELKNQVLRLTRENADLNAQNTELRKRTGEVTEKKE